MPYLLENEEEDQQQQGSQNINAPSTVLNSPGQENKSAQKSSGSYTNLQTYLDANKPQAEAMGQKVVGKVEESAKQAQSDVDSFRAAGPETVQKVDTEKLNSFYSNPANANKEEYNKIKSGYTGPTSAENVQGYDKATQSTSQANDLVNQVGTFEGRQNLLENIYARPDYSAGAKKLDAALLAGNPNARAGAEQVKNQYSNLSDYLNNARSGVADTIASNTQAGLANRQLIGQEEQRAVNDLYSRAEAEAKAANEAYQKADDPIRADLANLQLSPETLALLGLESGTNIYDLNLENYLTQDANTLNTNQGASPETRAQWAALQGLIGGEDARITTDGATSLAPVGFDKERLNTDLNIAKNRAQPILDRIAGTTYFSEWANPFASGVQNLGFNDMYTSGRFDNLNNLPQPGEGYYGSDINGLRSQMSIAEYDRYLQDKKAYDQLYRIINNSTNNTIKTPTGGTITGGLKG